MTERCRQILWLVVLVGGSFGADARATVIDFEDLSLDEESAWNGPDPDGVQGFGLYGPETIGEYVSGGVAFVNRFRNASMSWSGFGYSNTTDTTTAGPSNQFSAAPGYGRESATYAVAAGHIDAEPNILQSFAFDPMNVAHLALLPTIELPPGRSIHRVAITNSTYAAVSMRDGDGDQGFAKRFGGDSGHDPDWFRITAYGTDALGAPLAATAEFLLADYTSPDPNDDYLVTDWVDWDLSALADARRLHFNLESSDVGSFGMNTPAFFAIDDLTLATNPLPGDYNADGAVDAGDYTLWRDTLGDEVAVRGEAADGDLSGRIDEGDRAVWRTHYGAMATLIAVPEPTTASVVGALFFLTGLLNPRMRY